MVETDIQPGDVFIAEYGHNWFIQRIEGDVAYGHCGYRGAQWTLDDLTARVNTGRWVHLPRKSAAVQTTTSTSTSVDVSISVGDTFTNSNGAVWTITAVDAAGVDGKRDSDGHVNDWDRDEVEDWIRMGYWTRIQAAPTAQTGGWYVFGSGGQVSHVPGPMSAPPPVLKVGDRIIDPDNPAVIYTVLSISQDRLGIQHPDGTTEVYSVSFVRGQIAMGALRILDNNDPPTQRGVQHAPGRCRSCGVCNEYQNGPFLCYSCKSTGRK